MDSTKTAPVAPADQAPRRKRPQWLFPLIAFLVVWIPMSYRSAYNFGSRVRLTGPGHDAITPILDAWTQSAQGWLGPAAFVALFVFVLERWLEERSEQRATESEQRAANSER